MKRFADNKDDERLSLQARVDKCKRCPLHANRFHTVLGEGPLNSPVVLLGEGPGAEEDKTGRPFMGVCGSLLTRTLTEIGVAREQLYICNTVKCRPFTMEEGVAKNRPPSQEEIESCAEWLHHQLMAVSPVIIICMGATAAMEMIGPNFRITRDRGVIYKASQCNGILRAADYCDFVTAVFHPSYILRKRGSGEERQWKEDLEKAIDKVR